MADDRIDKWASIIDAVKTPLSFLVLGFIATDSTLLFLVGAAPEHKTLLVWCAIIFVPCFVFIVVGLAIWRPEALTGYRPLEMEYAVSIAQDIFISLDGYMRNLENSERNEAWSTLADVLISSDNRNKTYREFSGRIAGRILKSSRVKSVQSSAPDAR
mgnify:FL=1